MPGPGGPNERCRGEIPSPVRRPRTAAALWRRPSYRDRTGPSRSSPPVQKCCAEMMSVSVAGIQKNRCRTTVAEPMVETLSETALYRDQVGLFKAQPGRTEADLALSGQAGPSASRQFFARE